MGYRIERDVLGERQIPDDAYYGIQTLRGKENFHGAIVRACDRGRKPRPSPGP